MDLFLPAYCRVDIYDLDPETDRSKYVRCATTRAKWSFGICVGFLVVAIILLLFSVNAATVTIAVVAGVLTLMSGISFGFLAAAGAEANWESYVYEYERIKKDNPNFTVGQVKDVIRKERLEREQAQSRRDAAQIQANATNAQTSAILSMFANRRLGSDGR